MWLVFVLLTGHLVDTSGYLVVTSGYLIATSRYFWFLVLVTTINKAFSKQRTLDRWNVCLQTYTNSRIC